MNARMDHSIHTRGEKYVTLEYAALHAHVPKGYLAHVCRAGGLFFKEVRGEILIAESSLNSFIAKRHHTLAPHFAPADTPDVAQRVASREVLDDVHRLDADMLGASRTLLFDVQGLPSSRTEYTRQLVVLVVVLVVYSGIYVLANTSSRFATVFQQVHAMTANVSDSIGSLFGVSTQ